MTEPPIAYEHCDIPEGLTLAEWRRARRHSAPRPTLLRRLLLRLRGR